MNDTATILLVEDDASILNGMADLLRIFDVGYEVNVVKATDGAQGIAAMKKVTPDLIISDIMMPRLNGFEFLNKVRENPAWVHIPFIFLTAKGKKQDIMEGRRSGAELYITKPFVSSELLELVKSQLDRTFQLRRARQQRLGVLKRNLLQLLNHEFRTPLTYVTAYYDMLADSIVSVEDPSSLQEYLRGIQVGCVRLTNLVEDLIKIMDLRTGAAAAEFRKNARPLHNLSTLFRQRAERLQAAAAKSDIKITYNVEDDLPPVFGDEAALRDAIDRILDNALKFTQARRGGPREIQLAAGMHEGYVCLSVEDTGVGFPAQVQEQLFELFYQYDREHLEQQGSGSGLAIAKGYVDLHRGKIAVNSEVGKGSAFSILLPPYDGQHKPTEAQPETHEQQAKILIVEDDLNLLEGLCELMAMADSPYDLTVLTAVNGQEGLKVLEEHQPDLIISDVMMPVMGGYEFLERVRANASWLQIPFIFLTAKGDHEDVHRGRRSGAEEYITKPYDIDELMALTVTQLDRYFQRQGAMNQGFEDLKRSILAMLQPDFRGPLDLVTSHSEKLAEDLENVETDEDLVSSLHIIQDSSERLTRLVEDFIAMAEFRTGEAEAAFRMRAVPERSLGVVLYEAAYALQLDLQSSPVEFNFDLARPLPPVLCDRERLLDVFRRLINILIESKHPEEPTVRLELSATERAEDVCLVVLADGIQFSAPWLEELQAFLGEGDNSLMELSGIRPTWAVIKSSILLHDGFLKVNRLRDRQLEFKMYFPVYESESEASIA